MIWRKQFAVLIVSMTPTSEKECYGPFSSRRRAQAWGASHVGPVDFPTADYVVLELRKP
jgi:hypothetical protein